QEGVGGVDDDQVVDSEEGYQFVAGVYEVVARVNAERIVAGGVAFGVAGEEFEDGVPTADVAPAEIGGGDAVDIPLRSGFLQDGEIDGDVFAERECLRELLLKVAHSETRQGGQDRGG